VVTVLVLDTVEHCLNVEGLFLWMVLVVRHCWFLEERGKGVCVM
jgi:hypothetical protein